MSTIIICEYCGHPITFHNKIKSTNRKRRALNSESSIRTLYTIQDKYRRITNEHSEGHHQKFIHDFLSLSDISVLRKDNEKTSYKVPEYSQRGVWKIGSNFFVLIDKWIVNKLGISENHKFLNQKVTLTGDILIILRR